MDEDEEDTFRLDDVMQDAAQQQPPPYDPPDCTPPEWTRETFPTCNTMHETVGILYQQQQQYHQHHQSGGDNNRIQNTETKRLGEGFYRTGFLLEQSHHTTTTTNDDDVVLKILQMERDFTPRQYSQINTEALLLGHHFVDSPVMANLYSYCGGSVLVERGRDLSHTILPYADGQTDDDMRGFLLQQTDNDDDDATEEEEDTSTTTTDEQLLQKRPPPPLLIRNAAQLPHAQQKLDIALAMLESMALLHNFPDGPIAHDDISLDQWLWSMDTDTSDDKNNRPRVMLNDLNSVVPLAWSESAQGYCRPPHSSSGNFRSPEFFPHLRSMGTESDMYAMGCVLYCLLTGTFVCLCMMDAVVLLWFGMSSLNSCCSFLFSNRPHAVLSIHR